MPQTRTTSASWSCSSRCRGRPSPCSSGPARGPDARLVRGQRAGVPGWRGVFVGNAQACRPGGRHRLTRPSRPSRSTPGGPFVNILVITPHTDDFIYGVGGTLITHADDDIHIVAVSSIQQTAARDVAAAFGATIEFLEAPYHRISDHAPRVKDALAAILRERRPAYVFGPPATGDWTSDHTTVGRVLLDATDLAGTFAYKSRVLRFPIASTTLDFHPNVWIDLPVEIVQRKIELAAIMTRGLEDEWPADLVEVWGGKRAPALAEEFGVEADDSLAALLARPEVEAVVITSPHTAHRPQAEAAAAAGKHVYIEKPMSVSVADCDAIIAACDAA